MATDPANSRIGLRGQCNRLQTRTSRGAGTSIAQSAPGAYGLRLITREDTGIAAALIVGAVLVFQQPLHGLLEAMRDVEARYHLDLVPALTVLSVTLMFHQYRRRHQTWAEAQALAA